MYSIGFDPAYRRLGCGILDLRTKIGTFFLIDLATWNNTTYHLQEEDYGTLVYDLMRRLAIFLSNARCVAIEKQPPHGTRAVHAVQCHLESVIRGMYPQTSIYLVNMGSVRAFWNTHASTYALRKIKSMQTNLIDADDVVSVRNIFRKMNTKYRKTEFCVDPIEAMQMAIYAYYCMDYLTMTAIYSKPREFDIISYTCPINKPVKAQIKKIKDLFVKGLKKKDLLKRIFYKRKPGIRIT